MFKSAEDYAALIRGMADNKEDCRSLIAEAVAQFPQVTPIFWADVLGLLDDGRGVEDRAIDLASAYFDSAARQQFASDGGVDTGSCGGVMLGYRGNTRFAKALIARGVANKIGGRVYLTKGLPEGVRTQHRTVQEKAHDAFAVVASKLGFDAVEHNSYAD